MRNSPPPGGGDRTPGPAPARPSPLANRAAPDGTLHAVRARGTLMGNRGGRIHDAERRLLRRRWASRAWICCELRFANRRREVMGRGYTELFFLDEAVALAAGHRPCWECRRAEALAFAAALADGCALPRRPRAPEIDALLHPQRIGPPDRRPARDLPDGAMFADADGRAHLKLGDAALPWRWEGYGPPRRTPRGDVLALTPAATRRALCAGYLPRLHPSAERP